jgi:hypothetical protein
LLGDSPWDFLLSIGVARARINFGFSVPEILSIAAVLPIALNASTLRATDLVPFADLDVELIHNFYPREWTGLAMTSVVSSVAVARSFGRRMGRSSRATPSDGGRSARGCRPLKDTALCRRCSGAGAAER